MRMPAVVIVISKFGITLIRVPRLLSDTVALPARVLYYLDLRGLRCTLLTSLHGSSDLRIHNHHVICKSKGKMSEVSIVVARRKLRSHQV